MTLVAALLYPWATGTPTGEETLVMASDSRITRGAAGPTWDDTRKVFALGRQCLVGFAGTVATARMIIGRFERDLPAKAWRNADDIASHFHGIVKAEGGEAAHYTEFIFGLIGASGRIEVWCLSDRGSGYESRHIDPPSTHTAVIGQGQSSRDEFVAILEGNLAHRLSTGPMSSLDTANILAMSLHHSLQKHEARGGLVTVGDPIQTFALTAREGVTAINHAVMSSDLSRIETATFEADRMWEKRVNGKQVKRTVEDPLKGKS